MNFHINQLPYKQLEQIGITKERIQKLPKDELRNLLSGYPSNMKFLVFKDHDGNMQKVNARLSIYQTNEGVPGLKIHPYRDRIRNDMNLTKKEMDQLKEGTTVQKKHNNQDYLLQLDTSINELRKVRMDYIKVAEMAGNTKLTDQQKTDLLSGKTVTIRNNENQVTDIGLDLKVPTGIKMEHQDRKQTRDGGQSTGDIQYNEHRQQETARMKR